MYYRLNHILNKSNNKKFRNGLIKYLKSLDFDEFKLIYDYYSNVIGKLLFKYQKEKIKFLSKKWFKIKILKYKYKNIFTIFFDASSFSVIKIIDDETKKNDKYNSLVKNINEISDSLQEYSTYQMSLSSNPTTEELVRFIIMVSNNIYNLDELDRLIKELDRYK